MRQKRPEMVQMKRDDPLKGPRKPKNSFDLTWNHRSSYYRTKLQGHLGNIGSMQRPTLRIGHHNKVANTSDCFIIGGLSRTG